MKKINIPWDPNFYQSFSWYRDLYPINYDDFLQTSWPTVQSYNNYCHARRPHIVNHQQQTINFVPQHEKSKEFNHQYEPSIYLTGNVPTREDNWHDFFNMLVWTSFSHSKATINAQQYHSLKYRHDNGISKRTPQENALTLFDENGIVILSSSTELLEDIRQHAWKDLFWHKRDELNKLVVILFGHAIYEKLLQPYLGITGHSILFHVPERLGLSAVDKLLDKYLKENPITPAALQPFPIFGLPGNRIDNSREEFYDNVEVFRPKN